MNMIQPSRSAERTELADIAVLEVEEFVQRHITALWSIMERLSHPDAIDSSEALLVATDEPIPALGPCLEALQRVRAVLDTVSQPEIARLEREPGRPHEIGAAVRWFGARITDLEGRLRRLR